MPLQYTGRTAPMSNGSGVSYQGKDEKGDTIAVHASHEAIEDYGEGRVMQKGSDKYDAGQVNGNIVTVQTNDFK